MSATIRMKSLTEQNTDDYSSYKLEDENSWKYYNSYRINLNIGTPKVITNKVTSLVEDTKIRQVVSVFISNLLSLKPKFTLSYSRRNSTLPKPYNKRGISYVKLKQAVDWLVMNGYALEQRGKATPDLEARFSSYLWPTEKLTSMFETSLRKELHEDYISTNNYIVLKDNNKVEIAYKLTEEVNEMAFDMESINQHNSKFVFMDNNFNILNCSSFTRIFNEDFKFGGRLYRTDAHYIKHNDVNKIDSRLGITIDREPIVEVDFTNLHAMMLCAIEGINTAKFHGDIYEYILRYVEWDSEPQDRKLVKQAFNIMLNCDNSGKAMQAIQGMINSQPINQDRYTIRSGHVVWKMIYDVMTEFQKYFDNPDKIGLRLQRMDSDIAIAVCKHFVDAGRPIIPVHDSFIVWDVDGDDLLRVMTDEFKKVTGCAKSFPIFFRVESAYFPTENIVML